MKTISPQTLWGHELWSKWQLTQRTWNCKSNKDYQCSEGTLPSIWLYYWAEGRTPLSLFIPSYIIRKQLSLVGIQSTSLNTEFGTPLCSGKDNQQKEPKQGGFRNLWNLFHFISFRNEHWNEFFEVFSDLLSRSKSRLSSAHSCEENGG